MREPISLDKLTDEELQLLIGLLMVAVNADDLYSAAEAAALKRIAAEIGRGLFIAAAERLRARYPDQKSILNAVDEVKRPAARALIRDLVAEVSESDGLVQQEENLLAWLTRKWDLGLS